MWPRLKGNQARAFPVAADSMMVSSPRVTALDVQPKGPVIPLPGKKQQMAVYATYSDGRVRDVTAEAFLESSNTEVATVDRQGTVEAKLVALRLVHLAVAGKLITQDQQGWIARQQEDDRERDDAGEDHHRDHLEHTLEDVGSHRSLQVIGVRF